MHNKASAIKQNNTANITNSTYASETFIFMASVHCTVYILMLVRACVSAVAQWPHSDQMHSQLPPDNDNNNKTSHFFSLANLGIERRFSLTNIHNMMIARARATSTDNRPVHNNHTCT